MGAKHWALRKLQDKILNVFGKNDNKTVTTVEYLKLIKDRTFVEIN